MHGRKGQLLRRFRYQIERDAVADLQHRPQLAPAPALHIGRDKPLIGRQESRHHGMFAVGGKGHHQCRFNADHGGHHSGKRARRSKYAR